MSEGSVLLDCAASAVHRMAEEGCDWAGLDAIWLSHFHLDHCGGLAPFLFGTKYAPQTQSRTKPLRLFGPAGTKRLLDKFDAVNDYGLTDQPFPFEVVEVDPLEGFELLPGIEAVAQKTPHTPESHAIHITSGEGKRLVYTADTGFHEPLAAIARDANLFLIECSFVRDKPVEKHLELAEALFLIRKARPKRAMLTHLYPQWDEVSLHEEVGDIKDFCELIEATDGLRLKL